MVPHVILDKIHLLRKIGNRGVHGEVVPAKDPKKDIFTGFLLLNLKVMHSYILSKVTTAAHGTKRIEMFELGELPVVRSNDENQWIFSNIVKHFSGLKGKVEVFEEAGNDLFNFLVQRAFRGDL